MILFEDLLARPAGGVVIGEVPWQKTVVEEDLLILAKQFLLKEKKYFVCYTWCFFFFNYARLPFKEGK